MPAAIANATASRCSAGSPLVIKPPAVPQPKPSVEMVVPVFPKARRSMGVVVL
jgi:hypothetical protein